MILRIIADVNHAEAKAAHLAETMGRIGCERPDFDLDFLGSLPLDAAVAWLERLRGVGRKVAASTLNASRLNRPIFIADTHIVRVLQRLHFIDRHGDYRIASEQVTAGAPDWSGDDFLEFHRMTKRLGQRVCRPVAPHCTACPLARDCPSRNRV